MTTPKTNFAGLALIVALCAGFTLGLTAPAWAGVDEGVAAYKRGDYATALSEFRPLAERGDAESQYNLGNMYSGGRGVPRDDAEAGKWFGKAAEQGHVKSQYILGATYHFGLSVPKDYAKALQWYRKAAEQGHAESQGNLGIMYGMGQGAPQDDAEAVKWFRKAAEQGHAKAQNLLGIHYYTGRGVPQDYAQAHMWYTLAASSFPPGKYRDKAVKKRDIVAERMTPAQISEAEKLAREWRPKKGRVPGRPVAHEQPPQGGRP